MSSQAHAALALRLQDVDELMKAHSAVGGTKKGRRSKVEGLNRAAILMLSAHFEGYLEDLMAEALSAVNRDLDPNPLTRGFHNPWPDYINRLFAFLGMKNPVGQISWQGASNKEVQKNLKELVKKRNRIAHGVTGVAVKKVEVKRLRRYVEGFSVRFDGLVRSRVHDLTGTYPWPRS